METAMPRVALIKGDDRYQNLLRALNLIHEDIDRYEIEGKQVLLKPNLVSVSKPLAVTHVDAVKAVIDFIHRFEPSEVIIAEAPSEGNTVEAYRRFGYHRLNGVRLVDVNEDDYEEMFISTLGGGKREIRISKTVLEADYKISVARVKTHDHLFCTLTLKNMMGTVPHVDHAWFHGAEEEPESPIEKIFESNYLLARNLVSIVRRVGIDLGVVDGLVGMEGDGPVDGTPVDLGVAAAGVDYVAVDAVVASVMGFDPRLKADTYLADEEGLGIGDLGGIEVVGEEIDNVRVKFKPHTNYFETQRGWYNFHPHYSR
jgi:uncharacterized protein (DUF362 family)